MMAGSEWRHLNKDGRALHTKASYQGRESRYSSFATLPFYPLYDKIYQEDILAHAYSWCTFRIASCALRFG